MSSVALPDGVDGKNLTTELKDGVLEVMTPISAAALPSKIEIKTAPKAQVVGGGVLVFGSGRQWKTSRS